MGLTMQPVRDHLSLTMQVLILRPLRLHAASACHPLGLLDDPHTAGRCSALMLAHEMFQVWLSLRDELHTIRWGPGQQCMLMSVSR